MLMLTRPIILAPVVTATPALADDRQDLDKRMNEIAMRLIKLIKSISVCKLNKVWWESDGDEGRDRGGWRWWWRATYKLLVRFQMLKFCCFSKMYFESFAYFNSVAFFSYSVLYILWLTASCVRWFIKLWSKRRKKPEARKKTHENSLFHARNKIVIEKLRANIIYTPWVLGIGPSMGVECLNVTGAIAFCSSVTFSGCRRTGLFDSRR